MPRSHTDPSDDVRLHVATVPTLDEMHTLPVPHYAPDYEPELDFSTYCAWHALAESEDE